MPVKKFHNKLPYSITHIHKMYTPELYTFSTSSCNKLMMMIMRMEVEEIFSSFHLTSYFSTESPQSKLKDWILCVQCKRKTTIFLVFFLFARWKKKLFHHHHHLCMQVNTEGIFIIKNVSFHFFFFVHLKMKNKKKEEEKK